MTTDKAQEVSLFIYDRFSAEVDLSCDDLSAEGLTLRDVVDRSEKLINSVDLMESFARTSNAIRQRYGVRAKLPAVPNTTPIKALVESLVEQVTAAIESKELV